MVYDPIHTSVGGTHAIFVFRGRPEDYNLPADPQVPMVKLAPAWRSAALASLVMLVGAALAFTSTDKSA
jgi:formate dehydrogenase iron-sulfur subunit